MSSCGSTPPIKDYSSACLFQGAKITAAYFHPSLELCRPSSQTTRDVIAEAASALRAAATSFDTFVVLLIQPRSNFQPCLLKGICFPRSFALLPLLPLLIIRELPRGAALHLIGSRTAWCRWRRRCYQVTSRSGLINVCLLPTRCGEVDTAQHLLVFVLLL